MTLKEHLDFDPLSEAAKIVGNNNEALISSIGFNMMCANNKLKNAIIEERGDTLFNDTVSNYLEKVTDYGFYIILKESHLNSDNIEEYLYIMFHKKYNILLKFTTYTVTDTDGSFKRNNSVVPEPTINDASIYYNWESSSEDRYHYTSSGCWETNDIWVGDHDAREALFHKIDGLKENGTFIKWIKSPFLWLLTSYDISDNYSEINKSRIKKFPIAIQKIMGYYED